MNTNIADRPLSLAAHLRTVGNNINSGALSYAWVECHSCNCGLLARSILGLSKEGINQLLAPLPLKCLRGGWTELANSYCPVTGMTENAIFKALLGAGLQFADFNQLETLSNSEIAERSRRSWAVTTKVTKKRFMRSPVVVEEAAPYRPDSSAWAAGYMWTWASMIEEFHASKAPAVATDTAMEQAELRPLVEAK